MSTNDRFAKFIETKAEGRLNRLPLVHITDAFNLIDIISQKALIATPCEIFNKEILYLFYGKPAYRSKHNGNGYLSCNLPCALIFEPSTIENSIAAVYPFDTGAFSDGLFSSFFHRRNMMEHFSLRPSLTSAQHVVETFYQNNGEYFEGASRKNVELSAIDFEAQGYQELSRVASFPDSRGDKIIDERSTAIEIQLDKNIDLIDSLFACILPNSILDIKSVTDSIELLSPKHIETYNSIHKMDKNAIAGQFYLLVQRLYEKNGYLP